MKRCTNCSNSEPREGKDYCRVKKYFVSVQAEWCKDYEVDEQQQYEDARYALWKFFSDEHELTLTEGELTDIVREVEKYKTVIDKT